jgi:hypothetical protein
MSSTSNQSRSVKPRTSRPSSIEPKNFSIDPQNLF